MCLERFLRIIFQHLGCFLSESSSSALCPAKVLDVIYQRIVIDNKDTNELIYFENQFTMHYGSVNVLGIG